MVPVIAVVGATGSQGGSIISALRDNPAYKIRALTRDPRSAKARALASEGIEVVAADVDDEASLVKAFDGASFIFALTNFFEPFAQLGADKAIETEYQQGVNLARAAARTPTLKLYIWSTLPDSHTLSGGAVAVPHFVAKARVDEFIKRDRALLSKSIFLWVSFYASNLFYGPFTPFRAAPTGKLLAVTPVSTQTTIASLGSISNVGTVVAALVGSDVDMLFPNSNGGKYVHITSESYDVQGYYSTWAKAVGKEDGDVKVLSISLSDYETLFGVWGTEMGLMMRFWDVVGPAKSWQTVGQGDIILDSRKIPDLSKPLVNTEEGFSQLSWQTLQL